MSGTCLQNEKIQMPFYPMFISFTVPCMCAVDLNSRCEFKFSHLFYGSISKNDFNKNMM